MPAESVLPFHSGRRRVVSRRLLLPVMLAAGLSAAQAQTETQTNGAANAVDPMKARVAACVACHGKEGRAASDGYYPRIAGKPAGYLYNQLINFREGRRKQYPLMIYMVQHLSDPYLMEIAQYFSMQHPPYAPPAPVTESAATLDIGRRLTVTGDPARKIPACAACHGDALTGVNPAIPGLLGLPRDYINAQFGAWRDGARRSVAPDCMGEIAHKLTVEEVSAVSAWLSSRPVPADAAPAARLPAPLPLSCGSVADK
jgi:cytochrome c553